VISGCVPSDCADFRCSVPKKKVAQATATNMPMQCLKQDRSATFDGFDLFMIGYCR
jgi:hypothetical protein